jgi:hypothetical protein
MTCTACITVLEMGASNTPTGPLFVHVVHVDAADQPQFIALKAVDARCAVLSPPYVDRRRLQVDLVYPQVHQLADAQRMVRSAR